MRLSDSDDSAEKIQGVLDEYMQGDYCYFDLHPGYISGKAQDIFRECIVKKYPREAYLVANKMPYYNLHTYSDYEKVFQWKKRACQVDFFDYYMLHAITKENYELHKRLGGFEYMVSLKERQLVNKIGISFHDKPQLLREILSSHPELDFVVLQINFLDWDNPVICARENYEVVRKYNKSIIVMEPIKGGVLLLH